MLIVKSLQHVCRSYKRSVELFLGLVKFFSFALKLASWDRVAGRTCWDPLLEQEKCWPHSCYHTQLFPLASASEKPGRDQMSLVNLQMLGMKIQSFALT